MALSIILSLASYGTIIFFCIAALFNPIGHIDFVYKAGIAVYFFEFLSLHSAAMLSGFGATGPRQWLIKGVKITLCSAYLAMAITTSLILQSYIPALFFCASVLGKVFFTSAHSEAKAILVICNILLLVATTFAVVLIPFYHLFPFPAEVMAQRPPNASGLFVDHPQQLLIWGILYYSSSCGMEIFVSRKEQRRSKASMSPGGVEPPSEL